jgi:DNA-binding MarR family transcriptional regulator
MSRLVDGLVEKRLMERRPSDDDRRHVRLWVTSDGETSLREAREMAQAELAKALGTLNKEQRALLIETMKTLHDVFSPQLAAGDDGAAKS